MIEACHEAEFDRIIAAGKHDGNGGGRGLGYQCRGAVGSDEDRHLPPHQFVRQLGQLIDPALRVAVFDDDISADDEVGLFERLEKWLSQRGFRRGRPITEISDDRHRVLRARSKRPRRRATDNRDELAPPHTRLRYSGGW